MIKRTIFLLVLSLTLSCYSDNTVEDAAPGAHFDLMVVNGS